MQNKLESKNKRGEKRGDAKWDNHGYVGNLITPGKQPDFSELGATPSNFAKVHMKGLYVE